MSHTCQVKIYIITIIAASPLVATLCEAEEGVPTSCDWVTGDLGHLVVSFNTAAAVIYDAETGAIVIRLDTSQVSDNLMPNIFQSKFTKYFSSRTPCLVNQWVPSSLSSRTRPCH